METHKTLRDEFAIAALTGLMTSGNLKHDVTNARIAALSYHIADVMLEAREVESWNSSDKKTA